MKGINILPRQKEILKEIEAQGHNIYLLIGAVRSSKTITSLLALPILLSQCPTGSCAILGVSQASILRNIIEPLQEIYGSDRVKYNKSDYTMYFAGRKFWCIGAVDDKSHHKIKGCEFSVCMVDEAVSIPQSAFTIMMQRTSKRNAKVIMTTNPSSPLHWLKTDYVDNADALKMKVFKMKLTDNTSLTGDYIQRLKESHHGVDYKRFIEGEWTKAEGLVFPHFDLPVHTIDSAIETTRVKYTVACDWGSTNPCVFLLIGEDPYASPKVWVEQEHYFDSKKAGFHKTEYDQVLDCLEFCKKYGAKRIVVDPNAISFITALRREGYQYDISVVAGINDVLPGIHKIGSMIGNGDLQVFRHCKHLIQEMGSYCWDDKKTILGQDQPKKENDHCVDALRYFINSYQEPYKSSESMNEGRGRYAQSIRDFSNGFYRTDQDICTNMRQQCGMNFYNGLS